MIPMMTAVLRETGTSESDAALTTAVEDFVMHLNGKQTIYQMMQLADEVRKRGGRPSSRWRTSIDTTICSWAVFRSGLTPSNPARRRRRNGPCPAVTPCWRRCGGVAFRCIWPAAPTEVRPRARRNCSAWPVFRRTYLRRRGRLQSVLEADDRRTHFCAPSALEVIICSCVIILGAVNMCSPKIMGHARAGPPREQERQVGAAHQDQTIRHTPKAPPTRRDCRAPSVLPAVRRPRWRAWSMT